MTGLNLLPFVAVGLLGAVHCVGMCGGIVGAFSMAGQTRPPFPVAVISVSAVLPTSLLRVLAYNAGRIGSYMTAGALAGGIAGGLTDAAISLNGLHDGMNGTTGFLAGGGTQALSGIATAQLAGYWLANLMLIALGLTLAGAWHGLARLEQVGSVLWRRLQPMVRPLLPMDSTGKALALGALWGWVPCGMVYSVLVAAMLSGSAASGAAVMLAFGLGTLPALLTMGMAGARLATWTRHPRVRLIAGLIVLSFGVMGIVRASSGMGPGWMDVFCVTPTAGVVR